MNYNLIVVIAAFPLSFFLTIIIEKTAIKLGFVNYPNPIVKSHKKPIAYGGGIAIGFTLLLSLLYQSSFNTISQKILISIIPIILVGFFDDIIKLTPLKKFTLEILAVVPFLYLYPDLRTEYAVIFLLVILTFQNAWNLIDIMDGLLSGLTVIIFAASGVIMSGDVRLEFFAILSFVISASTLGFRLLNKYPAKIFLGDTGSLLLGTVFGFIVVGVFIVNVYVAFYLILLAAIPLFELIFLVIVRIRKGIPFYRGSPDHFALRMFHHGLSIKKINRRVLSVGLIHSCLIVLFYESAFLVEGLIIGSFITIAFGTYTFYYFYNLPANNVKLKNE